MVRTRKGFEPRRRSRMRRIHNESGGGTNKIKTQTRINPKTVSHAHSQCKRWRPHKIGTQTRISPKTVAHAPHSQCKRWRPQQNRNPNANQPEDGRTRAEFTMQAVAAPIQLKPRRESARRRSHTRRIHNASGGGLKKIETRTRISPKNVAHAPHSQCKRWRPQQN